MAVAAAAAAREDYDTALAIWVVYAHAGIARAQAELGRCLLNGWGVNRSVEHALKWLMMSAQASDPLGQYLLGDLHLKGESGALNQSIAEE